MESELREQIERVVEEYALYNALKHDAAADPDAIMGPLMGDHSEFRVHGAEIPELIDPIVEQVNQLDREDQRARLDALAPAKLEELDAVEESTDSVSRLPALPNADTYEEIRLRCAPNPNGPWHIGHARMGAVIGRYAERYDGWMLCRFDDTDPATKRPDLDAYDAILEDLEYLGHPPDEVIRASDRLERYYECAREVIDHGGAYTCACTGEAFSERKNAGEACPHRDKSAEVSLSEFEEMVEGQHAGGDMVLRIKTDLEAPNPAERDWVAMRMVDRPHPRPSASEYRCWPMLDFQSAIDDHDTSITHVIRGKDLQDSVDRQGYVYNYLDWEYPEVLHWGRISVDIYDVPMSTSAIKSLIADGELDGWDDPRAPTLQSLRRRGIQGDAVTEALAELGISESDVELAMSSIYAHNREQIDGIANRYFLVRDGNQLPLIGDVPDIASPPRHPNDASRGDRTIPVTETVFIEPEDIPTHGDRIWLKGLGGVRLVRNALEWTGDDIEVVRSGDVPVIHWVPAESAVPVTMHSVEGTTTGRAEPELSETAVNDVIQFERVGFVRVDAHEAGATTVYFSHQ